MLGPNYKDNDWLIFGERIKVEKNKKKKQTGNLRVIQAKAIVVGQPVMGDWLR